MFAREIAAIVAYALIPIVENRATMVIRIEEEKQEEYTQGFTWFGSVPTSTRTAA